MLETITILRSNRALSSCGCLCATETDARRAHHNARIVLCRMYVVQQLHCSHRMFHRANRNNETHKKMPSPFLDLPLDLQVDILHIWLDENINGTTLVLIASNLDIACCSKRHRHVFGELANRLPFNNHLPEEPKPVKNIVNYLQWLTSRKLRVKSLILGEPMAEVSCTGITPLESVELILWLSEKCLDAVLRVCPNVRTVRCTRFFISGAASSTVMNEVPHLTTIVNTGSFWPSISALKVAGHQIRELRVASCDVSQMTVSLSDAFPFLQALEVRHIPVLVLMHLLSNCSELHEVSFHRTAFVSDQQLTQIVSCKQLKTLTVRTSIEYTRSGKNCTIFADMVALRPDVQLTVGECTHCPAGQDLDIQGLTIAQLSTVLSKCPSVTGLRLTLFGALSGEDLPQALQELQGQLKSLTLNFSAALACDSKLNVALQHHGQFLEHLELACGCISDAILQVIAARCPQLQSLSLASQNFCICSGFEAVSNGCKHLKEVGIKFASRSTIECFLQSLIKHKLHLRLLQLLGCGTNENPVVKEDTKWFRNQCKEDQLLPVTEVVVHV